MLRKLHNKKLQKKIFLFLAIVIIPGFILWGTSTSIQNAKENATNIKIFGKNITDIEYRQAIDAVRNQLLLQTGQMSSLPEKFLEQMALQRLILLYEAKNKKIKITDREVVNFIQKIPLFWRKDRFDQEVYNMSVRYDFRTHARVFEEQMRQNLIIAKLYDNLTQAIKASDEEIIQAYKKENEEISISYISGVFEDFAKNITASDEQLKDYYEKNQLDFKKPTTYNLEYISLDALDKVETIKHLLKDKDGFEKIAQKFNLTAKETGWFAQYDPVPGIGWVKDIPALLPGLQTSQILPVIQIEKNYYVLKLKGIKEPHIPEFDGIKTEIKDIYIQKKAVESAKAKTADCSSKIQEALKKDPKSLDLEKSAKEFNLTFGNTELFKYGTYLKDIGPTDIFYTEAKKLAENQISQPIETSKGFFIIKLKSLKPIDEKKFSEEKEKFSQKVLDAKKSEAFSKVIEDLLKKAQGK